MGDDVSAYSGKRRPAHERMLTDIAEGRRDAVIVWHTDRLRRRPIELEQSADTCARAGVRDAVTLSGDVDLANDDGLLMARLLAAVAANESHSKSRRIARKSQERAEAGLPLGGTTAVCVTAMASPSGVVAPPAAIRSPSLALRPLASGPRARHR